MLRIELNQVLDHWSKADILTQWWQVQNTHIYLILLPSRKHGDG